MARRSLRTLPRRLAGGASGLVLALLLALGQQHAVLHWLSHAIESAKPQQLGASDAHDLACDECLALAAFDASSPAAHWAFEGDPARDAPVASPAQPGADTALRLAFRSRAPPILS